MKQTLIIFFTLLSLTLRAQERAVYRITYECNALYKKVRQTYRWNLDIGNSTAAFYNPNYRNHYKASKSLQASGNIAATLNGIKQLSARHPNRNSLEVMIGVPEQGKYTYVNKAGLDHLLLYEETIPDMKWKLADSIKTVNGYRCHQAEAEVYGRRWTVWYATELPISYGPYILGGLPGLILEAVDSESLFHFTAIGIENITDDSKIELLGAKDAIKCNRKKYLALRKRSSEQTYMEAAQNILGGSGSSIVRITDAGGNEISNQKVKLKNYLDIQ